MKNTQNIVLIKNLTKRYNNGFLALDNVSFNIKKGEILALLGPNGAGKTTLISIICGLTNLSAGEVLVDGKDIIKNYRETRESIGLVPQEISLGMFDKVYSSVAFSRGMHGKKPDRAYVEEILRRLSLYDKKNNLIMELSGGMKRRVLIAKALSHQPKVLFLDEPTAGVDVDLRKNMWEVVEELRKTGVTIILTTHYIEEAQAIADRVGVISRGKLIVIEDKEELMKKMGKQQLSISLTNSVSVIPKPLQAYNLTLAKDGMSLLYQYNIKTDENAVGSFMKDLSNADLPIKDLLTIKSSLEDIFIDLVN